MIAMDKFTFDKVVELAHFLEQYIPKLPKDDSHTLAITKEDRPTWDRLYKELILTNVLDDGRAFGQKDNNNQYGIGNDASGYRAEYYQLLMQCYRYLYQALSAGEVFLQPNIWRTTDRTTASLYSQPLYYGPSATEERNGG